MAALPTTSDWVRFKEENPRIASILNRDT